MGQIWMKRIAVFTLLASGFVMAALGTEPPQETSGAARQAADHVSIDSDDIGGVVNSSKGPEAGVWVIAETTDLPTKFRKIVVTDDQGRYLLPELPKARYKVWVRGYGLIDSGAVSARPGEHLALTAVLAPNAEEAAQYYPANYWFSLLRVPPKSAFPITVAQSDDSAGHKPAQPQIVQTQSDWIAAIKSCETCHQLGNKATREIEPSLGTFDSPALAWDRRIRLGQVGSDMVGRLNPIGRDHAEALFADWTDRIAKGEIPTAPPRPSGVERNLVISTWDIGTPTTFAHDLYVTDKRHPDSNANGPAYLGDFNTGNLYVLDPKRNTDESIQLPTRDDRNSLPLGPFAPPRMEYPSLYWGDELYLEERQQTEVKNVDTKGRLWMATIFRRPSDNPAWCKEGSNNKFAQYYPLNTGGRQAAYYDGKTKKETWVDTCFSSHGGAFGEDKDETIYWVGTNSVLGWVKPGVLDNGGSIEAAEGWCPAYYDVNGDGKYEKDIDKLIPGSGYLVAYNPVDRSVWYTIQRSGNGPAVPGKIVRIDIGSDPPSTCHSEVYEPPFNNPKAHGKSGFFPRGIDVDRNGVVWTALAGSGQLASFDRSKCKVLSGPESFDGQHCAEGWTLYDVPGPQMRNIADGVSADFLYGNWVDQFNTLGLGANLPIATGTDSDALLLLKPDTRKWIVLRVPYPLGFYTRNLTGRIDDPNIGWKGRGLWAGNEVRTPWQQEGGKGTRSEVVHFQIRPNPLAK